MLTIPSSTILTSPPVAVLVPKDTEQVKLESTLLLKQQQLHSLQTSLQLPNSSSPPNSDEQCEMPKSLAVGATASHDGTTREKVESMYKEYISQLHKYNEIKDAAQCLFGKLAEINKCTVQEIHKKYDLVHTDK